MPIQLQDVPKVYEAGKIEDKWYSFWLENKLFHSEPDQNKKAYSIVIPPPNITGMLTMGHILNNTIQDVLIRLKRMQGYNACWVPGTDHASISTESKVIKFLQDQGIDKYEIGREAYLAYCQEWKKKYGGIIIQQLKKLGVSCDWERERFTMDDHYYQKVIEAFVKLYNEGKIYKGYRLVNWCPFSKSAISDEEVIPREEKGHLWYLRYPVVDSHEYIIVATTRPETMLGDTGVAVNPNDERYAKFIGKRVLLPIVDREIPIFGDEYVDMTFGTGAVKVTPAHDTNDYDMGKRHQLDMINIFNEDATLNHNVPKDFIGLDRYEARDRVVKRFEEFGLIQKIEDYTHNVGYSERGGVPIEPYLSEQWFMKMDELVEPALKVVQEGKVKFYPDHWVKTYKHWMENINDWCISRQLWWGHRIPVWYCVAKGTPECEQPIVALSAPKECPHCKGKELHQEEDVLDTWASSWLWASDVFETEEEKKYYYPTDALVTAPDIIFFWVARMIMAGMHFENDIPFKHVYFTSVIRDMKGRKMSKSLGNSPDPLDVIAQYGADALRFTMMYLAPLGQDVLFDSKQCELGRNFANKLWNAGRYLLLNLQEISYDDSLADKHIDRIDEWMESRFQHTVDQFLQTIDKFEFNNAIKQIYSLIWSDFCDWYLELMKVKLGAEDPEIRSAGLTRAVDMFARLLQMIHPFMPFLSEELWHLIKERKENESISISEFPEVDTRKFNSAAEEEILHLQEIITGIRNIRGEMNIPPSKLLHCLIKSEKLPDDLFPAIKKLTRTDNLEVGANIARPPKSAVVVLKHSEIYIPLEGLIDLDAERKRLEKEIQRVKQSLDGLQKKLSNASFVDNAPEEIVSRERQKETDWSLKLEKLTDSLQMLQ